MQQYPFPPDEIRLIRGVVHSKKSSYTSQNNSQNQAIFGAKVLLFHTTGNAVDVFLGYRVVFFLPKSSGNSRKSEKNPRNTKKSKKSEHNGKSINKQNKRKNPKNPKLFRSESNVPDGHSKDETRQ